MSATPVTAVSEYPVVSLASSLDIPLKASEEVVSIDLENDLPEDPADLKTLLVEESSDKEHWLAIATAYCNQGMVRESIRLIEMALKVFQGQQSAPLHTFLTWAYLRLVKDNTESVNSRENQLTQAEVHLKDAIGYDPTWIGNMLATIDLYYQRGQYDKALETSELFVKGIHAEDLRNGRQSKPNVMFLLLRAKLLYQKKNYVASLKIFQELLVLNPVLQPDPRIGIGLCFWQLKDHKMAITSWERALELNNKNVNVRTLVLLGTFYNSLTESQNDESFKQNYTKALQDLNDLYAEDKESPVLLTLLQTYFYLKGDTKKVIDIYESKISKLSQLIPDEVLSESSFWCGRAHYSLGDYRKAFLMFQESLRRNEDNLLAKFGLGQTQIQNKLVEESILTFENIYKTKEGIQELNYILGLLYAAKCLDPKSSLSRSDKEKNIVKATQFLEKYIKLTKTKKNQPVILKAYLVLSQLCELQISYKQSLEYLSKVVQQIKFGGKAEVPLEILNNLGCFHFITGDLKNADNFFEKALQATPDASDVSITVKYNVARTLEPQDKRKAEEIYEEILSSHPAYIHAKIRSVFLKFMESKIEDRAEVMEDLLSKNEGNLEVRSFYSWYLKNVATKKVNEKGENLETNHNRETLVKYDSHDLYALISLANLYITISRDAKKSASSKDQEKSKQAFLKAIQLFQKVLQLDPLNIFAAQGLAIVFAENKRYGQALDILRKVRDSLDNEAVHINLGHCLLEMQEYAKAIENYEIALKRFGGETNKSSLLNLLGRAWYSRGVKEKSLHCFKRSLEYAKGAIEIEGGKEHSKMLPSLKFNFALLQFQIAESLRRSSPKDRTLEDLEYATSGLNEAISLLRELVESKSNFMPLEELEQRIQLGETTMKSALDRCIKEQREYQSEVSEKLANARKLMEETELKEQEKLKQKEEEERIKIAKQAEEFKKLQEEAQKLMQERAELDSIINDNDDNLPQSGDEEFGDSGKKKRKTKKRAKKSKKADGDGDDEDDEDESAVPKKKRRTKRAPAVAEEEAEEPTTPAKGKKTQLSNEFIDDSDEEAGILDDEKEAEAEASSVETPDNSDGEDGLF